MNQSYTIKSLSILFFFISMLTQCTTVEKIQPHHKIQTGFSIPSDDNTIWCYWYWIGDDISKEGITKDLEAMKAAGIGGALIGNINPDEKDGKVPMLSDEWWQHMVHAVNEGKRIGVDIGAFNCPGWSQSGGPWVKPEMAMRYVTYSETKAKGGQKVNLNLSKPNDEFQDTYVLAFPEAQKIIATNAENTTISTLPKIVETADWLDGDINSGPLFSEQLGNNYQITFEIDKPFSARNIKITPHRIPFTCECELEAETNGSYTPVSKFIFDRQNMDPNVGPNIQGPLSISFPEVTSNNFRLTCKNFDRRGNQSVGFSEISISSDLVLDHYIEKQLAKMHPTPFPNWESYAWEQQSRPQEEGLEIKETSVIDLTDKMDKNGVLNWNAPEGNWVIQRFGMTPTGTKNSPSAPQGKGYEVDKMSEKLARYHFEQFIGKFLSKIPEESKSAFKYVIADSYEMGSQNWTDDFNKKFQEAYGYDPKPFLPVYTGKVVQSVEASERFLWDIRRLVANQVAYEYVGGLRKISNEHNLKLWLENYGHWGFPSEFLMYGGQSNLVSGEFWNEGALGNIECKSASSAAHIYGKPVASAEAFTAANRTYVRHPAMLKKRGDWSFTEGINHFVLHLYIHQPDEDSVPGVNAWFSTEFNRHNTWFKKSKTYFDYLRRCQYLLQEGKYAADVCYFIGENAPIMTGTRNPELPDGYSYDYINAEVILNRLAVKDGKFVLPDGMTYNLMVLPPIKTMRPELLSKIETLVSQGGKIYGSAPEKSPSLQNYPQSDLQIKNMADKMWGKSSETQKKYGDGIIFEGIELKDALKNIGIYKDVDLNGQASVLWTHRTMPGTDIYFLTNQSDTEISFSPSFRIKGMQPQLWDAITGEIRPLKEFTETNGRTTIPITMKPSQSWFIVFTNSKLKNTNAGYASNFPEETVVQTLEGSWRVDFKNKIIGPKDIIEFSKLTDWIKNANEKIKHYSGTAVYTSTFNYIKNAEVSDVFIDLGNVGVMASVKINGKDVGTSWIAPYKLNITKAIQEGENTIEVEVVNVWRNRITGDKLLPEEKRTTHLLVDGISREEELISSGLLGPVTLQVIK